MNTPEVEMHTPKVEMNTPEIHEKPQTFKDM